MFPAPARDGIVAGFPSLATDGQRRPPMAKLIAINGNRRNKVELADLCLCSFTLP